MLPTTLVLLSAAAVFVSAAPLPLQSQAIAPYAILVNPAVVATPAESAVPTTPSTTTTTTVTSSTSALSGSTPEPTSVSMPQPTASVGSVPVGAEDFNYATHAVGAGGELHHGLSPSATATQDAPYAFLLTTLAPSLSHMHSNTKAELHLSTIEQLAAAPTPLPTFDFGRSRIGTVEIPQKVQDTSKGAIQPAV